MEITGNRLLPYGPAQQQTGRSQAAASFEEQIELQDGKSEERGELLPGRAPAQPQSDSQLDYREVIQQARMRQAQVEQGESDTREARRVGGEPLSIQQALGSYRATAELQTGGIELMPRLDDYA